MTRDYETIGFKPVDELVLAFKGDAVEGTDTIAIILRDARTRLWLEWAWQSGPGS